MGWSKVKDLAVSVRVYTDSEGKTKNQYKNVGAILDDGNGRQMIMLDRSFNPAGVPFKDGSERIIINQFDPKDDKSAQRQEPTPVQRDIQPGHQAGAEDDIPF